MMGKECLTPKHRKAIEQHKDEIYEAIIEYAKHSHLSDSWDLFDYHSVGEGDIEELDKILKKAKKGEENPTWEFEADLIGYNEDAIGEAVHYAVMDFLGDWQNAEDIVDIILEKAGIIDISDEEKECMTEYITFLLNDIDPDIVSELYFIVEHAMDVNASSLFSYPVLIFLHPVEEFDIESGYHTEDELYKFVKLLERKYGVKIPQEIAYKVGIHSGYAGFGIGIVVDGSELYDFLKGEQDKLCGDAMFFGHNGFYGSGYYEYLGEDVCISDLKDILKIDYGSYSLGAVFGTTDWRYR